MEPQSLASVLKKGILCRKANSDACLKNLDKNEDGEVLSTKGMSKKNYRIVIMGTAGVGKTSIINRYMHKQFTDHHEETIEELHHHNMKFSDMTIEIDILDTSGSYQFPAMQKLAIASGDAFVLVYSVDNSHSFETVKLLREQITESKAKGKYSIIVVANKTDLEQSLPYDHAVAESVVCMDWEEQFIATSAKSDENIDDIFQTLHKKIRDQVKLEVKRQNFLRRISLPVMKIAKQERSSKPFLKSKSRTDSFDS